MAETDRATYGERLTILVRDNLAAYIRSARWRRDDEDLRRLLTNLENGGAYGFVDERVDTLWVRLVEVSVDCARRRLAGTITPVGIEIIRPSSRNYSAPVGACGTHGCTRGSRGMTTRRTLR